MKLPLERVAEKRPEDLANLKWGGEQGRAATENQDNHRDAM